MNGNDLTDLLSVLYGPQKTKEELEKEDKEKAEKILNDVRNAPKFQTISIAPNVTFHSLEKPSETTERIANHLRILNEKVPYTEGNVDVYYPFILGNPRVGEIADGVTIRTDDNGESEFNTHNRVMILGPSILYSTSMLLHGWHMPIYDSYSDQLRYVITHEWAHVIDSREESVESNEKLMQYMENSLDLHSPWSPFFTSLSGYGIEGGEAESYAEAFAEWFLTKLRTNRETDNFAAKWYAKEYGWKFAK